MHAVQMNYLALGVGAAVSVVIGAVWYMPALFGNPWMRAIGKTKEEVARDFSPMKIAWAFVLGFVMSYGVGRLIVWTGMNTPRGGAVIGVLAAVTFVLTSTGVNHVFEGRSSRLTGIYFLHNLVALGIIGAILGAWM